MNRRARLNWRSALTFMTFEPGWRGKLFSGGLVMLVCPPVGWVLALGYRSLAGERLVGGMTPVLPDWRDTLPAQWRRGIGACGVILGYFTPFLGAYFALGLGAQGLTPATLRAAGVFLAAIALFPPAFLPSLPVLYARWYDWLDFTRRETIFLALLFVTTAFVLPAAFQQVALRRRYSAAFSLGNGIRFIAANARTYIEAWTLSLAVSAAAVCSVVLAPSGLFWSYLAILYAFNESLALSATPEVAERFAGSRWLRLDHGPSSAPSADSREAQCSPIGS